MRQRHLFHRTSPTNDNREAEAEEEAAGVAEDGKGHIGDQ